MPLDLAALTSLVSYVPRHDLPHPTMSCRVLPCSYRTIYHVKLSNITLSCPGLSCHNKLIPHSAMGHNHSTTSHPQLCRTNAHFAQSFRCTRSPSSHHTNIYVFEITKMPHTIQKFKLGVITLVLSNYCGSILQQILASLFRTSVVSIKLGKLKQFEIGAILRRDNLRTYLTKVNSFVRMVMPSSL